MCVNAQIRRGLALVLVAVLLGVIAKATPSDSSFGYGAALFGVAAFFAGIIYLIVGLLRRPRAAQPRQD